MSVKPSKGMHYNAPCCSIKGSSPFPVIRYYECKWFSYEILALKTTASRWDTNGNTPASQSRTASAIAGQLAVLSQTSVFLISAATRKGLEDLLQHIWETLDRLSAEKIADTEFYSKMVD